MKVWICFWTLIILSMVCAQDWSISESYSAQRISSEFNVDAIRIVNNGNTTLYNITIHPPEKVMVLNFWQLCEDGYCMAPYTQADNCAATITLARPIDNTSIILMVYKSIETKNPPSSGSPPQQLECTAPDKCSFVNITQRQPITKTETPPYINAILVILVLAIILMGVVLTMERLATFVPWASFDSSRLEEIIRVRDALKGSPIRGNILEHIGDGHFTSARLAKDFRKSQVAIKKHLDKLENAGLVDREVKKGRKNKYYVLTNRGRKLID